MSRQGEGRQSPEGISRLDVGERRETGEGGCGMNRNGDGSVRYPTGTNRKWISSLVVNRVSGCFEYESFAKQLFVSLELITLCLD
jgi:hypothetical protein